MCSLGGWPAVKSLRRSGEKVLADERILGTDDFVERVLGEAERRARHTFSSLVRGKRVHQIIATTCKQEGVSLGELQMGSRRDSQSPFAFSFETGIGAWNSISGDCTEAGCVDVCHFPDPP